MEAVAVVKKESDRKIIQLDVGASVDIYRNLTRKEKNEMQESIEKNAVKFSAALDEKILPMMPKTKNATLQGKRNFLKIIAERQARLQAQIDWLHREQEKYRKLREEI